MFKPALNNCLLFLYTGKYKCFLLCTKLKHKEIALQVQKTL